MALTLMEGNEAIGLGAISAGCKFFAGYPITPATTIYSTMLKLLPPLGGVCLEGEDEIASIGFCLGASMAGLKAMTATSGPGISLYSEQISFAIGSEIPLVIVDVQRLGPINRFRHQPAKSFLPFQTSAGQFTPEFLPIGGKRLVRQTSSTHGPDGYITTDPEQIADNQERLKQKLRGAVDDFLFYDWQPADAQVGSGFLNRLEKPIDICQVAGAAGAPHVSRVSTYAKDLAEKLEAAIGFEGFSLVDIWGICPGRYTRRNRLTPKAIEEQLGRAPAASRALSLDVI